MAAERAAFARMVDGADEREWRLERLRLLMDNTRLREVLNDIAMGVNGFGVLSKDNMRRRALKAVRN